MTKEHRLWAGLLALGIGLGMHAYYASASGAPHATTTTTAVSNVLIGAGAAFLVTYAL